MSLNTTKQNWQESYGSIGNWRYSCYTRVKEKLLVPENTVTKQWVTHQGSLKKPLFLRLFLNKTKNSCFPHKIANEFFFNFLCIFLESISKKFKKKIKSWSWNLNFISCYEFLNFYTVFQNSKLFWKITSMNRTLYKGAVFFAKEHIFQTLSEKNWNKWILPQFKTQIGISVLKECSYSSAKHCNLILT